jgi:dTDP-4-amino-4,6-dideoxygalactose transaminase
MGLLALVASASLSLLGRYSARAPDEAEGRNHVWHLYAVRHAERNRLQQALAAAGVASGVHYSTPVHLQPAYASLGLSCRRFSGRGAAGATVPEPTHLRGAQRKRAGAHCADPEASNWAS